MGQGREKARAFLEENADVSRKLEREIRQAVGLIPPDDDAPASESDLGEKVEEVAVGSTK